MEAALRAAGEPETWCLFRPWGIAVIVSFFFSPNNKVHGSLARSCILKMALPRRRCECKECSGERGSKNRTQPALDFPESSAQSLPDNIVLVFPQPAVKSLDASWQYSCVDQLCSQTGLREQRSNFCFISLFLFFLMNSLSKHVSCREGKKNQPKTTKLSKWRPTKRSDTLILTVDFYSRMIWRRTRRAPAPVYD